MKFSDIKMWILPNLLSQLTSIINITCGAQVLKHVLFPTPENLLEVFQKPVLQRKHLSKFTAVVFPLKFLSKHSFWTFMKYKFFPDKTFIMSAFIYYTNSVITNDDFKKNCTSTLSWTLFCHFIMHNFKWTFLAQIFFTLLLFFSFSF